MSCCPCDGSEGAQTQNWLSWAEPGAKNAEVQPLDGPFTQELDLILVGAIWNILWFLRVQQEEGHTRSRLLSLADSFSLLEPFCFLQPFSGCVNKLLLGPGSCSRAEV